jgi:hypothetical protein
VRRDRSHAHGTAARRAPMWAAGPPGCVGKRSAQQPQGAQGKGGLEGEGLSSVAQRPSRIGEPGTGIPVFAEAKMPPHFSWRAVRATYNFGVNPK